MPDQHTAEFPHEFLEADIKRLAGEVQKHRERSESRHLEGPELIKKSIQSLAPAPPPVSALPASNSPLPNYAADIPAEAKLEIEYLLDLAFHHGIEKADREARKTNPFIVDAFHDALATKLYPELQKRGIVK